jgi:hypothetical protein
MADDAAQTILELERLGDAEYDAMYEDAPHWVKTRHENAHRYFSKAVAAAEQAGLMDEVLRLSARRNHIDAVYNHQFRWMR